MFPLRGIALKLSSVFLFTIMAALVKANADAVPPGQAVFFRSLFALPIIVVWLAMRGDLRTGLKVQRPMGHVWRGVIGVGAMGFGFAALGLLPLPEVTALGYASPMLTVLFAAALLGERLRLFRLSAVALGLVGVAVVMWPRLTLDQLQGAATLGVICVLASAALRALVQIHIRRLVATEETSAIVFYFSLTATLLSLLSLPFGWTMPSTEVALMLVGTGLIGGVAQILLTSAYRTTEAAVLAPFDYASILFAILFGMAFFDEVPGPNVIVGSVIVMAAGVIIVWRERALGLQRGKARPNMTPHA
ncbi:DMT family transporter [Citreimonas sp.]|uniref:DMT family transporter n=1 Tax=Citreimonas sp. TaxID=3036715 RepID=UPI00405806FC